MERCIIAYSSEKDCRSAVDEVSRQIAKNGVPKLILFSSDYENFTFYSEALSEQFMHSTVIGMTTYIGFSSKGYGEGDLTAMALASGIECAAGVLPEITRYPMKYTSRIETAVDGLSSGENCCCLEFTTAFKGCEELVMDTFRYVLEPKGIPVFGSSAGAGEGIKRTLVSLDGITYDEACVFVIIHNINGKVVLYRENIFRPTEHFFVATAVDCDERKVYEYDGKPAAAVVANALRVPVEELPERLVRHPVGRVEGKNIYITENDDVCADGALTYYARIYNYTKVVLLEPDDIEKVWEATERYVKQKLGMPSFCIIVNCLARSRYFLEENKFNAYNSRLEKGYRNYIGISGYGEQMNFQHFNQTMLIAAFE